MKAAFNLKNFLADNREVVIAKFEELTKRENYNGISLKEFMLAVMRNMELNNPKSIKRAEGLINGALNHAFYNNSDVPVLIDRDANLKAKYEGTSYMALV